MKLGIITFHFVNNQGAALQCYALQTYLTQKGHDVQVINYRPAYHANKYAARKNPLLTASSAWKKGSGKKLSRRIASCCKGFLMGTVHTIKGKDKVKYQLFFDFAKDYLHQTEKYTSLRQLKSNPPAADVYISGSDQLWNPDLTDMNFDSAYFMQFGSRDTKRITYAVSLKEHFSDMEKDVLKRLCENLDGICIREANADLEACVDKHITVCADPTLLLSAKEYESLEAERHEDQPYLFVYGFENVKDIHEAVRTVAEEKGLKIINGSPDRIRLPFACENVYNFGPRDFLSYIKHADYVVTNSFHGTAFSIIYEKNFSVIAHSTRGRRMTDLLERVGCSSRIWDEKADWKQEIDYSYVAEQLRIMKQEAADYLQYYLT